jgi:hypothetical protein
MYRYFNNFNNHLRTWCAGVKKEQRFIGAIRKAAGHGRRLRDGHQQHGA